MGPYTTLAKIALPLLSVIGGFGVFGLSIANGLFPQMTKNMESAFPVLPGTSVPMKTGFTGSRLFDNQIGALVGFFWTLVDGSNPTLCLQSFHFAGQFCGMFSLMLIESVRHGNKGRAPSWPGSWGFLFQNISGAIALPIYYLTYLFKSPLASPKGEGKYAKTRVRDLQADITDLHMIPWAMVFGFIIPSVVISLPVPKYLSYESSQKALLAWQLVPVYCSLSHSVLRLIFGAGKENRASTETERHDLQAAYRWAYGSAIIFSGVPHTFTIITSLCTYMFPMIFAPGYTEYFSLGKLFVPPRLSINQPPIPNMATGVLQFMQWDEVICTSALLIFASSQYLETASAKKRTPKEKLMALTKIAGLAICAGPTAAAAELLLERDEMVFRSETEAGKKNQ